MKTTAIFYGQMSINLIVASLMFIAFDFQMVFAFDCPNSKTPPLIIKRKRFYDSSTDEYFPIKGIAYYPRPNDGPLSKSNNVDFYTDEFSERWIEDIANLKELGVNAIRLYAVDPSKNHDNFMCTLQEAGIYVMLGLLADCEDCGIGAWVGVNAEPPLCYPPTVKERGKFVIRSFSRYDNLMAFSAGNEVSIYADDGAGGRRDANIPCQKKFLRDMREYVVGCANGVQNAVLPRKVPIGLVNWDGPIQSFEQHVYYHCRTDPDDLLENTEWFALNSYRHCDGFATSKDEIIGWPELKRDYGAANFATPVMLGEYGCREYGFPTIGEFETQRTWYQAEALYTPDYSEVFAGGFVFEYSAEREVVDTNLQFMANRFFDGVPQSEWPYKKFAKVNYGIGYFTPGDCQHDDGSGDNTFTPCTYERYPEWDGLRRTLAQADTQNINPQAPGSIPECPQRFPPLSQFEWPTDEEEDADLEYCLELKRIEDLKTEAPASSPTPNPTARPTMRPTQKPTPRPTEDDSSVVETDAPTLPPSESVTEPKVTLSPTSEPSATPSFAPILTDQDITTISPTLPPVLSSDLSPTTTITSMPTLPPTFLPTLPPTTLPTTLPTAKPSTNPTTSPTNLPTVIPTNQPTIRPSASSTLRNTVSPTASPSKPSIAATTSSPSVSPTFNVTEINPAQCLFHLKCAAANLAGLCCPTADGVLLGCCGDIFENAAESSAETIHYTEIVAISAVLAAFIF